MGVDFPGHTFILDAVWVGSEEHRTETLKTKECRLRNR